MKNNMNIKNRIIMIVNLVLFIVFTLSIIYINIFYVRDNEDSASPFYEWDVLHAEYENISRDSVISKLGMPYKSQNIFIGERVRLGLQLRLRKFQKHPNDTVFFEQLYYKQGEFDFYLWLLPDKDSVWRVVEALKYDPTKIGF